VEPPAESDDALLAHAARVAGGRPSVDPGIRERLDAALAALEAVEFGRDQISLESSVPGGVAAKKVVGRVVKPQVDGLLDQLRRQQNALEQLAALLVEVVDALTRDVDSLLVQQIDDLQLRVAEQRRELNALRARQ
jgi:hypothetical protein